MRNWICLLPLILVGCDLPSNGQTQIKQLGRIQVCHLLGQDKECVPIWDRYETNEVGHDGPWCYFRDLNTKEDYRLTGVIKTIERQPLEVILTTDDPEDLELLKKNQGAVVNDTILPSGIPVPHAFIDRDWIVRGDIIHLEPQTVKKGL